AQNRSPERSVPNRNPVCRPDELCCDLTAREEHVVVHRPGIRWRDGRRTEPIAHRSPCLAIPLRNLVDWLPIGGEEPPNGNKVALENSLSHHATAGRAKSTKSRPTRAVPCRDVV